MSLIEVCCPWLNTVSVMTSFLLMLQLAMLLVDDNKYGKNFTVSKVLRSIKKLFNLKEEGLWMFWPNNQSLGWIRNVLTQQPITGLNYECFDLTTNHWAEFQGHVTSSTQPRLWCHKSTDFEFRFSFYGFQFSNNLSKKLYFFHKMSCFSIYIYALRISDG